MHPIDAVVRHPVKVTVGALLVALFGTVALLRMPMQLTPEVEIPTITVETRWPGASPFEVEKEIINDQEEFLQSVEGLTKMTSEARDSVGEITLEFLIGTNMDEALLKVNSRLQQVSDYPADADQPVISTSSSADRPIAWFILSARQAPREEVAAVQQQLQEANAILAAKLGTVVRAQNPGLAVLRLRQIVDEGDAVTQLQLAFLQPLQPQQVRRRRLMQRIDRRIEIAMLLLQPGELGFKLALIIFGHGVR
jgi:hydrophobic/amphiphilic exporter-1 (mainly G- bacteria), HAE1 family